MKIAFIGFGEAGQAFAGSLMALGGLRIDAYDILAGTPAGDVLAGRARALGVAFRDTPGPALEGADLVISAVTAADSLQAVEAVAGDLCQGQVLFDINSVSAARKQATAAVVRGAAAAYVDMAVMQPVHPNHHRTPTLVAGDVAGRAADLLQALDFDAEVIGPEPGEATTIKMIRSLFVKGVEALAVQVLTAAEQAGCHDRILASLVKTYDGRSWNELAGYQFERIARHGIRRAAEMRECAVAYREMGFPIGSALADAVADLQDVVGRAGLDPSGFDDTGAAARAVRTVLAGGGDAP